MDEPNRRPPHRFERIGHRGAPREFMENTVESFKRAFELGADAVELDVHATADGTVVVHHDPTLGNRVTPAAFRDRAVAELEWSELKQVEIGPGAHVPSLADVLASVPSGRGVYVEIKGRGIERQVAEVIRGRGATVSCAVHSFDHGTIVRMREFAPEIPRGLLFDDYPANVSAELRAADARDAWPRWKLIDAALVEAVHNAGGRVIAWTVNTRRAATKLTALGVDGLCGDDVRLL